MSDPFTDPVYLQTNQYRDAANLQQRINLHKNFSTNPQNWHRWVFANYYFPPNARVLEIGCGPGDLWAENLERIATSWTVTLSDLSEGMASETRSRLCQSESLSYACLNAQTMPFRNDTFDSVIANHMLYHLPHLDQGLSELRRVLKPGGRLYAATNGETHLQELRDYVSAARAAQGRSQEEPFQTFIRNFSLESGLPTLRTHFSQVELRIYPDLLEVTDIQAIVDFVQSSVVFRLAEEELQSLRRALEIELEMRGRVNISKDTGLFIASKPQ